MRQWEQFTVVQLDALLNALKDSLMLGEEFGCVGNEETLAALALGIKLEIENRKDKNE